MSFSERITQRESSTVPFLFRVSYESPCMCVCTPYVEDANSSGLGALFLCPLIVVNHHLLFLFPRSSLLCPPANLLVSYFTAHYVTPCSPCTFVSREPRINHDTSRRPCRPYPTGKRACYVYEERRHWTDKEGNILPWLIHHVVLCIANNFSDELPSAALLRQSEVRTRASFRPGRGADGCRATAVTLELSDELIFQRYQRRDGIS